MTEVERLVEDNLKLAPYIYHEYFRVQTEGIIEMEDMISVGYIGLVKAARTFNPKKGTNFSTYACSCIHREMYLVVQTRKQMKRKTHIYPVYYDGLKDEGEWFLRDRNSDFTKQVEARIMTEDLLPVLTEKQRDMVEMNFGMNGYRPHIHAEIAAKYGVSRQHVWSEIDRAVKKMKRNLGEAQAI